MAIGKKNGAGKTAMDKPPYLTKRILVRAATAGTREAATETMAIMGYNVVAEDGWIVKKDKDGNILKKLSKIQNYSHSKKKIILD